MRDGATKAPAAGSGLVLPRRRNQLAGVPGSGGCSSAELGSGMTDWAMSFVDAPSTPEFGNCGLGVWARPAVGASAVADTAAATTMTGRQRRNTGDLPAAKARTTGADRVTSEAAKPIHLRRQRAKRQPPGHAGRPRVNGVKTVMVNGRLRPVLPGRGECGGVPSTHGVCLSNGPWADVRLNFEYGHQWVTAECPLREVNVFLPSRCDRLSGGRRALFGWGRPRPNFRAGDLWSRSSLHFAGRMGKTDRKYAQSHRPYSVRIR